MNVIVKKNKADLQLFLDTLLEIIDDWGTIVLPELISINKTWKKYTQSKDEQSYITVNKIKDQEEEILSNPNSIFISLLIWK